MLQKLRYKPPVCLLVSLFHILTGKLKYSTQYLNKSSQIENSSEFTIFRQIIRYPVIYSEQSCVFIVRFKFKHLSHQANKLASKIPMLLIAGQPGFISKCYAVDQKNGYWQGIYQWESIKHLENYKKSFVYRMMNKRAIPESIQSSMLLNQSLDIFIHDRIDK